MSGELNNPIDAYVALGSNLGDRRDFLCRAINALNYASGVSVGRVSSFVETDPVGPIEQGPFLNAVCRVSTTREPRDLLQLMLMIEAQLGRVRDESARWGPRTIDLDLILYADRVIREEELVVPHPRLSERAFVLVPLCEIAPGVEIVMDGVQTTAAEMFVQLRERSAHSQSPLPAS